MHRQVLVMLLHCVTVPTGRPRWFSSPACCVCVCGCVDRIDLIEGNRGRETGRIGARRRVAKGAALERIRIRMVWWLVWCGAGHELRCGIVCLLGCTHGVACACSPRHVEHMNSLWRRFAFTSYRNRACACSQSAAPMQHAYVYEQN